MEQGSVSHGPHLGSGLVDQAGPLAAATSPGLVDEDVFSFLGRLSSNTSPPGDGSARQRTSSEVRGAGSAASPKEHLPRPGRQDGVPPTAAAPPAVSGLAAPQPQSRPPSQPSTRAAPQPVQLRETSSADAEQPGSSQASLLARGCSKPPSVRCRVLLLLSGLFPCHPAQYNLTTAAEMICSTSELVCDPVYMPTQAAAPSSWNQADIVTVDLQRPTTELGDAGLLAQALSQLDECAPAPPCIVSQRAR